jgi:hypothetical protein
VIGRRCDAASGPAKGLSERADPVDEVVAARVVRASAAAGRARSARRHLVRPDHRAGGVRAIVGSSVMNAAVDLDD